MMKLLNVHLSTSSTEAERFDTLVSPSGTVATLNQIAHENGLESMGFDGAFPDQIRVQQAVRDEIEAVLKKGEMPLVLLSLLVYNAEQSLAFIQRLKEEFGDRIATVVGGQLIPFATQAYVDNEHIDVVCVGDGEALIPQLARDAAKNALNPYYSEWLSSQLDRSKRGQFSFTSYEKFFHIRERLGEQKRISGFSQLCIQGLGGPGCSWAANNKNGACDFCALQNIEEMNGRTLADLMLAEKQLEDAFDPDRLFDVANQFLPFLNKHKNIVWLKQYIEERKKTRLKAQKYVYLTVGSVDEDIAPLLKEAGVEEVFLGIDHFDPVALKEENKSHRSQSRLQRTLDALAQNGIRFRVGVVLGAASETVDSLKSAEEGATWITENYSDSLVSLGVYPVYILPGSGVYERVRKMSDVRHLIHGFESKGFFTEDEEVQLTRHYIQRHSVVDADAVLEVSSRLLDLGKESVIAHNYRHSPGADRLKKKKI